MNNYNDNPITIDVNSRRNQKQKILCVLCFPKIQLDCIDETINKWRCPRCKNTYSLGFNEINEFSDELESSHSEEEFEDGIGLLVEKDEFRSDNNNNDNETILDKEKPNKSDIKVPKYFQNSETVRIVEYRES